MSWGVRGFRWMAGMRDTVGDRVLDVREGGVLLWEVNSPHYEADWCETIHMDRPDLSDPATVGCFLVLLAEAWGPDVTIGEMAGPNLGSITISNGRGEALFRSEASSVGLRRASALEAAP